MSHRRSTVKGSLSFANPTVRAWLFQILAVVAVVGIVGWLFHNTVTNLSNRGITSGFAFLDRGAGFGIVQHLIDYQQGLSTTKNTAKMFLTPQQVQVLRVGSTTTTFRALPTLTEMCTNGYRV